MIEEVDQLRREIAAAHAVLDKTGIHSTAMRLPDRLEHLVRMHQAALKLIARLAPQEELYRG